MEIGTWNGKHSFQMIKEAQKYTSDVKYYGFDIFEDIDPSIREKEGHIKSVEKEEKVKKYLNSSGAEIFLHVGYTTDTLPAFEAPKEGIDFVFIDGGHSLETIERDWSQVKRIMNQFTVVLFDDYYPGDLYKGCYMEICKTKEDPEYDVEILEPMDTFDNGKLKIEMIKVTKRFDSKKNTSLSEIYKKLEEIIKSTGEVPEGNIYTYHKSFKKKSSYEDKAANLAQWTKGAKTGLEIGFNAGHSAALLLTQNPELKLTCFDIGRWNYAKLCFDFLEGVFGDRVNIVWGDSAVTIPDFLKKTEKGLDFYHVDGAHRPKMAKSDLGNCVNHMQAGNVIIADDTNAPKINKAIDNYIKSHGLIEFAPLHNTDTGVWRARNRKRSKKGEIKKLPFHRAAIKSAL
jgi:predicted O-methyltransferase YrrM